MQLKPLIAVKNMLKITDALKRECQFMFLECLRKFFQKQLKFYPLIKQLVKLQLI